jgi:hypothetical protein
MRRRFFAVVKEAFIHWPVNAEFQADDAEHLRAWLLTKVGYRTQTEIPHKGLEPAAVSAIAVAVIRASGKQSFPAVHNGRIYILTPKSIAKAKSKHKELVGVFESVEHLVCNVLGIESCDQLLKEQEKVA